ncbi:MAG: Peptidoglycan-N-acetylmuramic acid deacetylase PdaA precursor [candidate division BRC1 bacterium ADurb.Bin183]|nr:MAG: Peptidoglycan-N-acetylmuramic acid deacetylase PdaA precursor [candidate division BRC1 bacterium ADurb.Bin183]
MLYSILEGDGIMIKLMALGLLFSETGCASLLGGGKLTWVRGGIERGPTDEKKISLVFTGGSFGEGGEHILNVLKKHGIKGSFFFTGDFFRMREFDPIIRRIVNEGHYLGTHSDKHPLYCPWEDVNKTLVTKEEFTEDVKSSFKYLEKYGVNPKVNKYWIPPYEWYNEDISRWSNEMGLVLFNYSPGSYSNADYTGEEDSNFRSSDFIYGKILEKEEKDPNGLNGFFLLIHIGAGPGRKDKFFVRLDALLKELEKRGYSFIRVDEMIAPHIK